MNPSDQATDHLRVIRSLMERATIYRAISGPTAIVGGIAAVAVGGSLLARAEKWRVSPVSFVWIWIGVLAVVSALNVWFLYRGAQRRGEVFASAGMKHALAALAPALVAGFAIGLMRAGLDDPSLPHSHAEITAGWTLFYGLALLATGSFAPRSMRFLGAAFALLGTGLFWPAMQATGMEGYRMALRTMIGCFGILHIIYGIGVVVTGRRDGTPAV